MYYAADLLGRALEIVRNVIRPAFAGPLGIQPVTGTDKESGRTRGAASLDVRALVTHDESEREFSPEGVPPFLDESGFWLAAGATVFRGVRAGIDGIEDRAFTGKELDHTLVDRLKRLRRTASASNHRLVADYHNRAAELIQEANAVGRSGQQLHAFNRGQVMPLDVDSSIAVEENDHAGRASVCAGAAAFASRSRT